MCGLRREEPVFQFHDEQLLLLGFLHGGKTHGIRLRLKLGRQRTLCTKEKERDFFKAIFPARVDQARPPVVAGKIFAREGKFFEIILEQEPRTLLVRAGGEAAQKLLSLGDGILGIGQLTS